MELFWAILEVFALSSPKDFRWALPFQGISHGALGSVSRAPSKGIQGHMSARYHKLRFGSIPGFGVPMCPRYGPVPSVKGSELWDPMLKMVHDGLELGS